MNWNPLYGLLAVAYAGLVFWLTAKKPEKLWNIGKIQAFVKVLGDKGTDIFFYLFGIAALFLGLWFFTL
jgi:hypothetical protein